MNLLKTYFLLFAGLILLVAPACNRQEEPDRALVVNKLRASAKLATVEYVVSKMLIAKKQREFIGINIGKEATFMAESKAVIKAGIDLNKIREEDIKIDGHKINLLLPPIEITNFSYPAENFKPIAKYSDAGIWSQFTVENKDLIYREGELQIRTSIRELGIDKTAEINTRKLFERILRQLSFTEIYIQFKENKEGSDL